MWTYYLKCVLFCFYTMLTDFCRKCFMVRLSPLCVYSITFEGKWLIWTLSVWNNFMGFLWLKILLSNFQILFHKRRKALSFGRYEKTWDFFFCYVILTCISNIFSALLKQLPPYLSRNNWQPRPELWHFTHRAVLHLL